MRRAVAISPCRLQWRFQPGSGHCMLVGLGSTRDCFFHDNTFDRVLQVNINGDLADELAVIAAVISKLAIISSLQRDAEHISPRYIEWTSSSLTSNAKSSSFWSSRHCSNAASEMRRAGGANWGLLHFDGPTIIDAVVYGNCRTKLGHIRCFLDEREVKDCCSGKRRFSTFDSKRITTELCPDPHSSQFNKLFHQSTELTTHRRDFAAERMTSNACEAARKRNSKLGVLSKLSISNSCSECPLE